MLLASKPVQSRSNFGIELGSQIRARYDLVDEAQSDQPPQRRIDAADIPEVCLVALGIDEIRNLPIPSLMFRDREQPARSTAASSASPDTAMPMPQMAASRVNTVL